MHLWKTQCNGLKMDGNQEQKLQFIKYDRSSSIMISHKNENEQMLAVFFHSFLATGKNSSKNQSLSVIQIEFSTC